MRSLMSFLGLSLLFTTVANAQYFEEYFIHPTAPSSEQLFDGLTSLANPSTTNQPTVASTGYFKSTPTGSVPKDRVRIIRTDAFGTPIFNNSYKVLINNVEAHSCGFSIAEDKNRYIAVGNLRDPQVTTGGCDLLIMQVDAATGNPIVTNKVDMDGLLDIANCIIPSKLTPGIFYICGENFAANYVNPTSFILRYDANANVINWVRRFTFNTNGVAMPSSYYSISEHTNGDVYAVGKLVVSATNTDGLVTKLNAAGGAPLHRSYHRYSLDEFRSIRPAVGFRNFVIGGNCKTTANDPNSVYLLWLNTAFTLDGQVLSTQHDADYCYDAVERRNTAGQFEYFTAGRTRHTTATGGDFEGSTFKYNIATTALANYLYGDSRDDNFYGIDYYSVGSPIDGITMFGQYTNNLGNSWHVKAYMNGLTDAACTVELPQVSKVAATFVRTSRTPTTRDASVLQKITAAPDKHKEVFLCKGTNAAGSNALVQATNNDIKEATQALGYDELTLYPNPMNDNATLTIVFELPQQSDATIQLYDQVGRLLQTQLIEGYNGTNTTELDMSNLPKGAYFVRLLAKDLNLTKKLIK